MKQLFKVSFTFRKQSFEFYVYAKSRCHAFNLVVKQIQRLFPGTIYLSEFSDISILVKFNFLR